MTSEGGADLDRSSESWKKSDVRSLGSLLKNVYQFHVDVVAGLEAKTEELEKKCSKLERVKHELLNKGRDLQSRYDKLLLDHERTVEELDTAKKKLQAPCEACQVLRGQLEQQEKLYAVMVTAIKTDKHGAQRDSLETSDGGTATSSRKYLGANEFQTRKQSPRHSESSSVNEERSGSGAEDISPGGTKGRSLKLLRNVKRSRSKYTEEIVPDAKKQKRSSSEHPAPWVQPGDTQTNHHDNTVDVLAPQTCDLELKVSDKSSDIMCVPETVPMGIDDCQFELPEADDKRRMEAPKPKYVPTGLEQVDGSSTRSKAQGLSRKDHPKAGSSKSRETPSQQDPDMTCHPRNPSSTSEPTSPIFGSHKEKGFGEITSQSPSLFDEDEDDDYHLLKRRTGARSSKLGKQPTVSSMAHGGLTAEKAEHRIQSSQRLVTDLTANDTIGSSPSVLTGKVKSFVDFVNEAETMKVPLKKQSSDPTRLRSSNELPRSSVKDTLLNVSLTTESPSTSGRKLKQTTLRLSGTGEPKKPASNKNSSPVVTSTPRGGKPVTFDPDVTVDVSQDSMKSKLMSDFLPFQKRRNATRKESSTSNEKTKPRDIEEEQMLAAKAESLRHYKAESTARDHDFVCSEISFTEPQFTSTQVPKSGRRREQNPSKNVSSKNSTEDFKKPLVPRPSKFGQEYDQSRVQIPSLTEELSPPMLPSLPPIESLEHDLNGTVDPNVRLSQFAGARTQEAYQDAVSAYSIEMGKYRDENYQSSGERSSQQNKQKRKTDTKSLTKSKSSTKTLQIETESPSLEITGVDSNVGRPRTRAFEPDSEDFPEASGKSVVFGKKKPIPQARNSKDATAPTCRKPRSSTNCHATSADDINLKEIESDVLLDGAGNVSADYHDDSFDRVPKPKSPGFAYVDVVRKKDERQKLDAFACRECEKYYSSLNLPEEEKRERMKGCRHRARFARPPTPEHYWSVGFPDTQELEERGFLNTTQAQPSKFRRKRGLRPLFLENEGEDKEPK